MKIHNNITWKISNINRTINPNYFPLPKFFFVIGGLSVKSAKEDALLNILFTGKIPFSICPSRFTSILISRRFAHFAVGFLHFFHFQTFLPLRRFLALFLKIVGNGWKLSAIAGNCEISAQSISIWITLHTKQFINWHLSWAHKKWAIIFFGEFP